MTRPWGARWSSVSRTGSAHVRSVASNTGPSRFDAVSSGPTMRNDRGLARTTSRSQAAATFVASLIVEPGRSTATP